MSASGSAGASLTFSATPSQSQAAAVTAAAAPPSLSTPGLAVWLRPESLVLSDAAVGVGGAGKLGSWPNSAQGLSIYNAHPSNGATSLPSLAAGVANGHNAAHFRSPVTPHRVGSAFTVPVDLSVGTAWSIFLVARVPGQQSVTPISGNSARVLGSSTTPLAVGFAGGYLDTLIDTAGSPIVLAGNASVPASGSGWKLYEYLVTPDGSEALFSAGTLIGVSTTAVKPADLQLGGSIESYVAEVLVFTVFVTTDLRQQLESYLCFKYGIPLPLAHPYNSTGLRPGAAPSLASLSSGSSAWTPDAVGGLEAWLRPESLPSRGEVSLWPNAVARRPDLAAYVPAQPLGALPAAVGFSPAAVGSLNGFTAVEVAQAGLGYINIVTATWGPVATGFYVNNTYAFFAAACNGQSTCRPYLTADRLRVLPASPSALAAGASPLPLYVFLTWTCVGDPRPGTPYTSNVAAPASGSTVAIACSPGASYSLGPLALDIAAVTVPTRTTAPSQAALAVSGLSLFVVYSMATPGGSPVGGAAGEWCLGACQGVEGAAFSPNGGWLGGHTPTSTAWFATALIIDSIPLGTSFAYGQASLYSSGSLISRGFFSVPQSFQLGVATSPPFKAFIVEVLVYGRALFDTERQMVEAMLSSKYALPLPASHPFAAWPGPAASQSASRTATPSQSRAPTYTATATSTATPVLNAAALVAALVAPDSVPAALANVFAGFVAVSGGAAACVASPPTVSQPDTGYYANWTLTGSNYNDISTVGTVALYLLVIRSAIWHAALADSGKRRSMPQRMHQQRKLRRLHVRRLYGQQS
jgi:hypothetical protein